MLNLKNTGFSKHIWKDREHPAGMGGRQIILKFSNNFGASIVKFYGSYGYDEGLFELAVIKFEGEDFNLTYNTPITDDVLGYLSRQDCIDTLDKIKNLECE